MSKKAAAKYADPEEEGQEMADDENEAEEQGAAEPAGDKSVTKAEAIRRALAGGMRKPEEAVEFIRDHFGLDVTRQHFSAAKSQIKSKQGGKKFSATRGKPGRRSKASHGPFFDGGSTVPPHIQSEPDLLLALESVKGLVETYGADKLRRIVDLLS